MASYYKPGDELKVKVSSAYIRQFADRLDAVNAAANKAIFGSLSKAALIEKLEFYNELSFDVVATIMETHCRGYTKLASALTCEFYNGIRDAANLKTPFNATLWEGYDGQRVRGAAYAIMEEVVQGKNTVPLEELLQNLSNREIKNAADATVRQNIKRDPSGPKYAIVPNGAACAFCQCVPALGTHTATKTQ